jgi:hypothetical protein
MKTITKKWYPTYISMLFSPIFILYIILMFFVATVGLIIYVGYTIMAQIKL